MGDGRWRSAGLAALLAWNIIPMAAVPVDAAPLAGRPAAARPGKRVVDAVFRGTTRPLHELPPAAVDPKAPSAVRRLQDRLKLPKSRKESARSGRSPLLAQAAPFAAAMPAPGVSFEGVGNISGAVPPDTQGDVGHDAATGRKYYVQWVNLAFQIWDVTDPAAVAPVYGPAAGNTLWEGTGTLCASNNDGDPITQFDHLANRWMMSQFALGFPDDFHQCIAVSATADPTGPWHLYDFRTSTTVMNDYPHFGVWPDGYYMSVNQFDGLSLEYAGAGVAVFERAAMLAGLPARMIYVDTGEQTLDYGGMLPTDLDGPAPAAGTPNYFVEWDDRAWLGDARDILRIWEFRADWENVANSTFGANADYAPNLLVPTADVDPSLCPAKAGCIPQPGTPARLDPISDRLMYRLQYRDFGSHRAIVGNHTVDADGADRAGIHWFELRDAGAGWAMHQEGVYAPDTDADSRWMGSAAMDASGGIALGFSVAGVSTYPSVRYAGRLQDDPPGTLPHAETSLVAGTGSQTSNSSRWGDYSMLAVDAADGCTFWYTQEYYAGTSSSDWRTRIGSFRFPSCAIPVTGIVTGTVTDGSNPLPGARVAVSGGFSAITDADGFYRLQLPAASYDFSVSAFGYSPGTAAGVVVAAGETTVRDFALDAAPASTIAGTVADALGGWPLYARIEITPAYPGGPIFTDPLTGAYSVELPDGVYTFTLRAMSGGYGQTAALVVLAGDTVRDFALAADLASCTAPGYAFPAAFFAEDFEAWPLAGWTVADNTAGGLRWLANDDPAYLDANYTGGAGRAATVDSDDYMGVPYDTVLLSPAIDPLGLPTLNLRYRANYQDWEYSAYDALDLDVSGDGGANWTSISVWTTDHGTLRGATGERVSVDLAPYVSGPFRMRWRYHSSQSAPFDWYAQIDEVRVSAGCAPLPAVGLVLGAVRDDNTGALIPNASVRGAALDLAMPIDSSADPAAPGRMYVIAMPAGAQTLTAGAPSYGADTRAPAVVAGGAVRQDFRLAAGRLAAAPGGIVFDLTSGAPAASAALTVTNSGALPVSYTVFAFSGAAPVVTPTGPFAAHTRHFGPKNLHDRTAAKIRVDLAPRSVAALAAGEVTASWSSGLTAPWGICSNMHAGDLWLSSSGWDGGDDFVHRYLSGGTPTGDAIDTGDWVTLFGADMAFNPFTRTLWQVNVGGDNCIYELNPAGLVSTGNSICPAFGTPERGLAFDPLSGTYYAGSWNDGIVNHFAADGTLLDSMAVDLAIAGLAFNPATGHLFVLANAAASTPALYDVYVLDTRAGYAILGGFNLTDGGARVFGDYQQAGLELDCGGMLWAVNLVTGQVFAADSGERGVCAWEPSWLRVAPGAGIAGAGAAAGLTVSVNAAGLASGTYRAFLRVATDTPYGDEIVPVTLNYTAAGPVIPPTVSLALGSLGAKDGWILESGENSRRGGVLNRTGKVFRLGDDGANRQYRALLHFDTSGLPDDAVVTSATVKLLKRGRSGSNPFRTHGALLLDAGQGHFGATSLLEAGDFRARAGRPAVARFGASPAAGWYSASLGADALAFVNKTGVTQLRLRFARDDNNDRGADYLSFASGDAGAEARPQLIVEYHLP